MSPIYVELREARQKAGLFAAGAGDKSRGAPRRYSHIETRKAQRIDLDLLERLCRALGVQPSSLFRITPRTKSADAESHGAGRSQSYGFTLNWISPALSLFAIRRNVWST